MKAKLVRFQTHLTVKQKAHLAKQQNASQFVREAIEEKISRDKNKKA